MTSLKASFMVLIPPDGAIVSNLYGRSQCIGRIYGQYLQQSEVSTANRTVMASVVSWVWSHAHLARDAMSKRLYKRLGLQIRDELGSRRVHALLHPTVTFLRGQPPPKSDLIYNARINATS